MILKNTITKKHFNSNHPVFIVRIMTKNCCTCVTACSRKVSTFLEGRPVRVGIA